MGEFMKVELTPLDAGSAGGFPPLETLFYNNPCYFLGQSEKFVFEPTRARELAWA